MKEDTSLRNLWFFDLATMLALLFMAVIMLRLETAKSSTNPTIVAIASNDSSNFRMISGQVYPIFEKLPENEVREKWYKQFQDDSTRLEFSFGDSSLILPKYYLTKYKDLDEFARTDILIDKKRELDASYTRVIVIRDSLLDNFLRETKIERKLIGEDDLMFPVDRDIPYPRHPITGKDLNQILQEIYPIIDSFLAKGYNIVKVVGHTDPTDDADHNSRLSQRRAEYLAGKIRQYIKEKYGSDQPYIVQATGYGEFQLLKRRSGELRDNYWQRNRRVELLFSKERFPYYQRN